MSLNTMDHDRRNRVPRILTEAERARLDEFIDAIHYSSRYTVSLSSLTGKKKK